MEITESVDITAKCFKSKDRLLDSLNIVYNEVNSMFIFWNKYQIFVYEDQNFESASKIIVPEFIVSQVFVSNNYLMCLDASGNVLITSLKFKNSAQKRLKSCFQPREHGVCGSTQYNPESILSLKYEANSFYLYLNRMSVDFALEKKVCIKLDDQWKLQNIEGKCILRSSKIFKEDFDLVKLLFNMETKEWNEHSLVIISPDKYTVYGCLFSAKATDEEIKLTKLYATPSEICEIKLLNMDIILGVKTGTIIKLNIKEDKHTLVHINTGITKFVVLKSNQTILYTDGSTMWKAEKTFSNDIKFNQFFIKQVKDFAKFGDMLICTTYSNLFYIFSIDDGRSYIKFEKKDNYCPAEKFLKNSDCYYKILEEIDNNNNMLDKINDEGNFLTALSLSRRQEIMDTIIDLDAVIYESYEDSIKQDADIFLTEHLYEYFNESFLFLIKLTASVIKESYSDILSNIRIHVTLLSEEKVLKTTSIQHSEVLTSLQVLVPLQTKSMLNASQVILDLKIVKNIPGVYVKQNKIWVVLYRKQIIFNSEHFIKTNTSRYKNVSLNEPEGTIDSQIEKVAASQHGHLILFTDISINKSDAKHHTTYVKLRNNFKEIFKNNEYCSQHFNSTKADFLKKQLTSEEFLKSSSNLTFDVLKEKVDVEIVNDFSCPLLKVTCNDIKIAFHMRNFFANIVYNDYRNYENSPEYVNSVFYTTTEVGIVYSCIL